MEKQRQQDREAAGHIASIVRKKGEVDPPSRLVYLSLSEV